MLTDIYSYLLISDCLVTAGQPTEKQFGEISRAGFDVIINLAMPTSTNV